MGKKLRPDFTPDEFFQAWMALSTKKRAAARVKKPRLLLRSRKPVDHPH